MELRRLWLSARKVARHFGVTYPRRRLTRDSLTSELARSRPSIPRAPLATTYHKHIDTRDSFRGADRDDVALPTGRSPTTQLPQHDVDEAGGSATTPYAMRRTTARIGEEFWRTTTTGHDRQPRVLARVRELMLGALWYATPYIFTGYYSPQ